MELKGKNVIILVEQVFNDLEFWYPFYRLKEEGAEVTVVGSGQSESYTGKSGTTATADKSADDIQVSDYSGLVIPGGYAPDHMRRYPAMVKLVTDMVEMKKPVAAICHAGWMLVSAGILKGRTVTSFFAIKDDLINAGANWIDKSVVVDDNLITSRTPDDLPDFMREFLTALKR